MSICNQNLTNLAVIEERMHILAKMWEPAICPDVSLFVMYFMSISWCSINIYIYGISIFYLNSCERLPNEIQHMSITFMNLNKSCHLFSLPSPSLSLCTLVDKHLWTTHKSGNKRKFIIHWIKFLLIDFYKINYWSTFLSFHFLGYGELCCHVFS